MYAIVSITEGSQGQQIQLLGWGQTESDARIDAAHRLHPCGHCDKAEIEGRGFMGGAVLKIAEKLEKILRIREDESWDDTYDQEGALVESSANDNHHLQLHALMRLSIDAAGRLDTTA